MLRAKLATRIALAVCFTLSATFIGSVAGAVVGAQLIPARDPIDAIANSIAGMTIGCGLTVAVATYVASRLELGGLRRSAAVSVTISTVLLLLLFAWERKRDARLIRHSSTAGRTRQHRPTRTTAAIQGTIDRQHSMRTLLVLPFGTLLTHGSGFHGASRCPGWARMAAGRVRFKFRELNSQ